MNTSNDIYSRLSKKAEIIILIGLGLLVVVLFQGCATARVGIKKNNDSILGIQQATGNMTPERYQYNRQLEAITNEIVSESKIEVEKNTIIQNYLKDPSDISNQAETATDSPSTTAIDSADGAIDSSGMTNRLNRLKEVNEIQQAEHLPEKVVNGRRAMRIPLYVINNTPNYVLEFTEEPFKSTVGELGPDAMSAQTVILSEGYYELKYLERIVGRKSYGRPYERTLQLYIKPGDTKITIRNR